MDIVFANDSRVVSDPVTGAPVGVVKGSHWPAGDPVVRAYKGLFTDDPRFGLSASQPLADDGYPAVERTTAEPGERRTRARRKRATKKAATPPPPPAEEKPAAKAGSDKTDTSEKK